MTFLSATSDAVSAPVVAELAIRHNSQRAPFISHLVAALLFVAVLAVPGAVAQAKWSKMHLILTIMGQRCVASLAS